MIVCPPLLKVPPSMVSDLPLKVSAAGVTRLLGNSLRTRYCGNKYSCVDINGKLWLKRSDLKKQLDEEKRLKESEKDAGKKKGHNLKTAADSKKLFMDGSKIGNLSPNPSDLSTKKTDLSTARRTGQNRINKREVRQRILAMINTERGKKELYFWTVSFPKGTTDDKAFQIYNIWLTSLRKYKMLRNYIWVAERQENGTIHYHLAIPHKMNVHRANAMMQGTLKGFAKKGEIPFHPNQCRRYNGVDIAKNRNTKRVTNFAIKKGSRALVTYLTKYIAKNDGTFSHLAWHNSRGYSSLFTAITLTVPEFQRCCRLQKEKFKGLDWMPLHMEKKIATEFFVFRPWVGDPPPWFTNMLYNLNSFIQSQLN